MKGSVILAAAVICIAGALLEGLFAKEPRKRFAELTLPRYSPPFWLWAVIGVAYYALCFYLLVLFLPARQPAAWRVIGLAALIGVLLINAGWNAAFFRLKSLRASTWLFLPYGILVLAVVIAAGHFQRTAALLAAIYAAYLCFAFGWTRSTWRLNRPALRSLDEAEHG